MTSFAADNRKSNALLLWGVLFLASTYFTITASTTSTRLVGTAFLVIAGLTYTALALIRPYRVYLTNDALLVKSRFNLFSKRILLSDIKKVKVRDKEYPLTIYRNTILHLLLWDKKFSRFKQIQLFDLLGSKLFTIDGQAIDNGDFNRLVRVLKK